MFGFFQLYPRFIMASSSRNDQDEFRHSISINQDESALMTRIAEDAKLNHTKNTQEMEQIPVKFEVQASLWPSFYTNHGLQRIYSAYCCNYNVKKASPVDITHWYDDEEDRESMKSENPYSKEHVILTPNKANDTFTYFHEPRYNDGSPIIVVPIIDFAMGKNCQRGYALHITGSSVTIVVDCAEMGEQIFDVDLEGDLMSTKNIYVFWDKTSLDEIRWNCGLSFPRVFLLKEGIPEFSANGTVEDLFCALGFRNRLFSMMDGFETEAKRRNASDVLMLASTEMLHCCLKALVPVAPTFVERGVACGNCINSSKLIVGSQRWEPPLSLDFKLLENAEELDEVRFRFKMSTTVLNPFVFQPKATMVAANGDIPNPGFWYLRHCTQTTLSGCEVVREMQEPTIDAAAIHFLQSISLPHVVVPFIPKSLADLEAQIAADKLRERGSLILSPILRNNNEGRPCRGLLLFCPAANALYIMDAGLLTIQMATIVDQLGNVKFLWSHWEGKKLRIDFGMKLHNTVLLRSGLSTRRNEYPEVFAAGMLFLSLQEMNKTFQDWINVRDRLDEDAAISVLGLQCLTKLIHYFANHTSEVLTAAAIASPSMISAAVRGFRFPDAQEALAIVVAAAKVSCETFNFTGESLRQFYNGYLARWYEAHERGVPQDTLLSPKNLLTLGQLPILEGLSHIENELNKAWQKFVNTTELQGWWPSRTSLFRRRLQQRLAEENGNQCELCPIPPTAHLGCYCGSILTTYINSMEGLGYIERYILPVRAGTDEERERTVVNARIILRCSANFFDCVPRISHGKRVRFDFFRRCEHLHLEQFPNDRKSIIDIVTRFVQPLGKITFVNSPLVVCPENTAWLFGGEFSVNCLNHARSLPKYLEVFSGLIGFQVRHGPRGEEQYVPLD